MALPIWLTWNVQMSTSKKVSIRVLFGSGFICILFASVRVAQVAINAARPQADNQTLDPTWLAIWGMVECSIGALDIRERVRTNADLLLAVIIGCCPAFAILVNACRSNTSYDSGGYRKQTDSNADKKGTSRVELRTIGSRGVRGMGIGLNTTDSHWAGAHSSQEELRTKHDGIMVSTTTTVTHMQDSA
jgi:hypothetical protein